MSGRGEDLGAVWPAYVDPSSADYAMPSESVSVCPVPLEVALEVID